MKLLKKSFLVLLIAALMVSTVPASIIRADSGVIYQTSTKETLTSGAALEKITRFTNDGWLNINVIKVDLSNPYIKVDSISDPGPIKYLNNTKKLAKAWGAVAAINGGFFNWISGGGYADGPLVESGKIISADNEYNRYSDSMGTFAISQLNEALYNYWKTDITLTAPNGASTVVMQYNKPSKLQYTDFTIIDRRWSETSVGNIYNDVMEVVVENGKIKEIRQNQPPVEIPQNGYVIITRQQGSTFINNNFKVGDAVVYSIQTNPDWQSIKMAVTGSAILVKDGKIPDKFSMNIAGRHPRTIIGSTQDGKQLLLVTVDGRQKGSIGMTQSESAQLMLELGAYNALNLDGGGSTTMVAREPGSKDIEVVNTPSDGITRAVSNAVAVFSIAPPSELDGFIIESADTNVFVNTSRSFTVKGYDRYFNPIAVDSSKIQWSVKGVDGYFEGSRFYPKSTGQGKIVATLGNVSSEQDINVLSSPAELQLSDRLIKLSPGQSKAFTVKGKSQDGFYAVINPQDISWSVSSDIGSFDKGVFKAAKGGTGYIDAAIGDTHAYCGVSVGYAAGFPEVDMSSIPRNSEYSDESIVSTEYIKNENSFRFSVLGQSRPSKNLLEKLLLAIFTEKSNTNFEAAAFVGPGEHDFSSKLKISSINTSKGYKAFDLKTSRFIQLDISSGGIRTSANGQWQWFLQQLNSFNGDNIFIFMPALPDSFSDSMEADLFQKVLSDYRKSTGKNIWVICKWAWNTTKMEQGVKYITVSGLDGEGLSPDFIDAAKMLVVTVRGEKATMEFKPIT